MLKSFYDKMPIRNKYPAQDKGTMHKQIRQAVDDFQSLNLGKQAGVKEILRKYVYGEIGLEEAYYDLLDNELILMPQRCGMHGKIQEDEKDLKEYIKSRLFS